MHLFQKIQQLFRPKLTCQQVNQFLVDYLDERLPLDTRVKFEKHLSMCPKCTPFFDQYNATIQIVKEDGQLDIPPDLAEHTLTFLRKELDQ